MIWANSFCVNNNIAWFVHGDNNLLMKCELENGWVSVVRELDVKSENGYLYYGTEIEGNKILFFPGNARDILIYEIANDVEKKITINSDVPIIFRDVYRINNFIYAVPAMYKWLIAFDICEERIDYLLDWGDGEIDRLQGRDLSDSCIINNIIVSTIAGTNRIIIFDVETKRTEILSVGGENVKLSGIGCINNLLILCDSGNGLLILYDVNNKRIIDKINKVIDKAYYKVDNIFSDLFIIKRIDGDDVERIIIDKSLNIIKKESFEECELVAKYSTNCTYYANGKTYFFDFQNSLIKEYNVNNVRKIDLRFDNDVLQIYANKLYKKNMIFNESRNNNLKILLNAIMDKDL